MNGSNGQNSENREVIRCKKCNLNQFITISSLCRRCRYSLSPVKEIPEKTPQEAIPKPIPLRSHFFPEPGSRPFCPKPPNFGSVLRALREDIGYNQVQMSHIMGIKRPYLNRVEGGFINPGPSTLTRLCSALRTTLSDLLYCYQNWPGSSKSAQFHAQTLQILGTFRDLGTDQKQRVLRMVKDALNSPQESPRVLEESIPSGDN